MPIKRGLGDGTVFPYDDTMFNDIVEKAKKQREAMDVVQTYDGTQPVPTTTEYEPERLSSIESTAQMT